MKYDEKFTLYVMAGSALGIIGFSAQLVYSAYEKNVAGVVFFLVPTILSSALTAIAATAYNSERRGARYRERRIRSVLSGASKLLKSPGEVPGFYKRADDLLTKLYGKDYDRS